MLSIIDQPNPELTKHFDWLPLYKSKTLWWSGRTKESSLIWNGKLRFLATLRTNEYLPSYRRGCDDVSYVYWIHSLLWECHHVTISLWNQILNPPWVDPPYSKLGWLVQQAILWIPIVPASQGGNTRPRSMKLGKRKEVAAVCNKNDTCTTSSITSITSRESTRWWHSLQNKSR